MASSALGVLRGVFGVLRLSQPKHIRRTILLWPAHSAEMEAGGAITVGGSAERVEQRWSRRVSTGLATTAIATTEDGPAATATAATDLLPPRPSAEELFDLRLPPHVEAQHAKSSPSRSPSREMPNIRAAATQRLARSLPELPSAGPKAPSPSRRPPNFLSLLERAAQGDVAPALDGQATDGLPPGQQLQPEAEAELLDQMVQNVLAQDELEWQAEQRRRQRRAVVRSQRAGAESSRPKGGQSPIAELLESARRYVQSEQL
eukprot:SAG11_NODE_9596_length_897_cov_1.095238_1_plen_260_part_10